MIHIWVPRLCQFIVVECCHSKIVFPYAEMCLNNTYFMFSLRNCFSLFLGSNSFFSCSTCMPNLFQKFFLSLELWIYGHQKEAADRPTLHRKLRLYVAVLEVVQPN